MSLLSQAMEDVVLMEKKREPDGEGGFLPAVWVAYYPPVGIEEVIIGIQSHVKR